MPERIRRPRQQGEHVFRDPISRRLCVLRIGVGVDRLRPGLPGAVVSHGTCPQPANVSPDLDNFYCSTCGWNGRVSGEWVMDLLAPLWDEAEGTTGGETDGA